MTQILVLFQNSKNSLSKPNLLLYFAKNHIFCYDRYIITYHVLKWRFLYISQLLRIEILKANYDDNGHFGFLYYNKRIGSLYYILNFLAYLKVYIKHCTSCYINQIYSHLIYKNMQPILSLLILINFVIRVIILTFLWLCNTKYNLITMRYKFINHILPILDYKKSSLVPKALTLFDQLYLLEYSLLKVIIYD